MQALLFHCRSNLIVNMHRQYVSSGYVWEQYDDKTGQGKVNYSYCIVYFQECMWEIYMLGIHTQLSEMNSCVAI